MSLPQFSNVVIDRHAIVLEYLKGYSVLMGLSIPIISICFLEKSNSKYSSHLGESISDNFKFWMPSRSHAYGIGSRLLLLPTTNVLTAFKEYSFTLNGNKTKDT